MSRSAKFLWLRIWMFLLRRIDSIQPRKQVRFQNCKKILSSLIRGYSILSEIDVSIHIDYVTDLYLLRMRAIFLTNMIIIWCFPHRFCSAITYTDFSRNSYFVFIFQSFFNVTTKLSLKNNEKSLPWSLKCHLKLTDT